jgi:hypothetical protein
MIKPGVFNKGTWRRHLKPVLYIQAPLITCATRRWWPCYHEVEGSNRCTYNVQEGDIYVNIQRMAYTNEAHIFCSNLW